MAWPTRRPIRQPVMIPGVLKRPARGLGFLPSDTGGDGAGMDWGAWWDQFPFDSGSSFWGGGSIDPVPYLPVYGPAEPTTAPLPGYCPRGQYHPVNDPYACVPFPAPSPTAPTRPGQPAGAAPAKPVTRPKPTAAGACPAPFVYDPKSKKCQLPPCPAGQQFSVTQGRCLPVSQITPADTVQESTFPWWAIIAGGVVLIALTSGRRR
jgi:hypothetical protein